MSLFEKKLRALLPSGVELVLVRERRSGLYVEAGWTKAHERCFFAEVVPEPVTVEKVVREIRQRMKQ